MKSNLLMADHHEEPVMVDGLMEAVETIVTVAETKGLTFDQVAQVYHSQSINRLVEVLVDKSDQANDLCDDLKDFASKQLANHRNWCYDNQPLKIKIEK